MKEEIYIIDYSSISSLGLSTKQQVDNLLRGKIGYEKVYSEEDIRHYGDMSNVKNHLNSRIKESFEKIGDGGVLHNYLLECASKIKVKLKTNLERVGIFVGLTSGDQQFMKNLEKFRFDNSAHLNLNSISGVLAEKFNVQGDVSVISQACASSIMAIIQGCRAIESGDLDVAIIGSADAAYKANYTNSLDGEVLSKKNFIDSFGMERDGTVPSGGAGILILTNGSGASGLKKIAKIRGYGSVNKSVITKNPATGINSEGYESSIRNALSMAKLDGVDFIAAHATGTIDNDIQEAIAIKKTLKNTPVTFLKKFLGHGIGACTIIELSAYLELMKREKIFGVGIVSKDPRCDIKLQEKVKDVKIKNFLINGAGFYGAYASLIIENMM